MWDSRSPHCHFPQRRLDDYSRSSFQIPTLKYFKNLIFFFSTLRKKEKKKNRKLSSVYFDLSFNSFMRLLILCSRTSLPNHNKLVLPFSPQPNKPNRNPSSFLLPWWNDPFDSEPFSPPPNSKVRIFLLFHFRVPKMEPRDSSRSSLNGDFGFGTVSDRRFAFSRQASFQQQQQPHTPIAGDSGRPFLSRTDSSIDIPTNPVHRYDKLSESTQRSSFPSFVFNVFRNIRSGHRYMKRLFLMISLNVAYSTAELLFGLFTGRVGKIQFNSKFFFSNNIYDLLWNYVIWFNVELIFWSWNFCWDFLICCCVPLFFFPGLVSDAFHLTFGCGLLTFSLFVMAASRKKPDREYTYGWVI